MTNSFEKTPTPVYDKPNPRECSGDFGKEAEEQMVARLAKDLPGYETVKGSSEFDDEEEHVDMFISFENGSELAIDATCTNDPEEQRKKIKETLENPIVKEHDDNGQVINHSDIPKAVFFFNKSDWGKAYNKFLKGEIDDPIKGIDKVKDLKDFKRQILTCFKRQMEATREMELRFKLRKLHKPILALLEEKK